MQCVRIIFMNVKENLITQKLRPPASYPVYPPYHRGLYLEEYFFDFYQRNIERFNKLNRKHIPIFWTNCYVNGVQEGWGDRIYMADIQKEINTLDPSGSYFTVCQHDDAPMNPIPPNTIIFSAGGNVTGINVVPIPLLCGPLAKQEPKEKELLASFVGSETHEIRKRMISALKDYSDIYISTKGWEQEIKIDQLTDFIESSLKSKFVLCPRGYGATSFRLYEAMQLGSVPVYISDRFWCPWLHELNWNEFCVIINSDQIDHIHSILSSISDETYEKMQRKIEEVYKNYFTLEGTCNKILQVLEMENE